MSKDAFNLYLLARTNVNDVRLLEVDSDLFKLQSVWVVESGHLQHFRTACRIAKIDISGVFRNTYSLGSGSTLADFLKGYIANQEGLQRPPNLFIAASHFIVPEPLPLYLDRSNANILENMVNGYPLESLILPGSAAAYKCWAKD